MNKPKISFWTFLFKIGDDYLSFLRNLTPVILFLSLALFTLPKVDITRLDFDGISLTLFAFGALFIALSVMAINIATFLKKAVKALYELHQNDIPSQLTFRQTLHALWQESDAKLLIFICFVMVIAIVMVLVYGMNYAFNFYRTISSIAD